MFRKLKLKFIFINLWIVAALFFLLSWLKPDKRMQSGVLYLIRLPLLT